MAELIQSSDTLSIRGALTVETVSALFAKPLTQDSRAMDLAEVSEIDSAGLALLVFWKQQANLVFSNIPDQVLSMIKISNLQYLMDVDA